MTDPRDALSAPDAAELERIHKIFRAAGGEHVVWGAKHVLEVMLVEHQMKAARVGADQLTRATWCLVFVTTALTLATVALVFT